MINLFNVSGMYVHTSLSVCITNRKIMTYELHKFFCDHSYGRAKLSTDTSSDRLGSVGSKKKDLLSMKHFRQ